LRNSLHPIGLSSTLIIWYQIRETFGGFGKNWIPDSCLRTNNRHDVFRHTCTSLGMYALFFRKGPILGTCELKMGPHRPVPVQENQDDAGLLHDVDNVRVYVVGDSIRMYVEK